MVGSDCLNHGNESQYCEMCLQEAGDIAGELLLQDLGVKNRFCRKHRVKYKRYSICWACSAERGVMPKKSLADVVDDHREAILYIAVLVAFFGIPYLLGYCFVWGR